MKRRVEILVLSDIHLGSKTCKATELLNYLKSVKPQIIILNGDIIDTAQLKSLPSTHLRVINRFMKLMTNGTRIYYLTGNHDASLRRFSDFNSGNLFLRDQLILKLGNKKYWFFHGDVLDNSMIGAQWLSHFFARHFGFLYFFNKLFKGNKSSKTEKYIQKFEEKAISMAHTEGYDAVVCGHVHQPEIKHSENIVYLNSGDWIDNLTALEYSFGEWSIYKYDPLDFDLINPKLHVKDIDIDNDELKMVQSTQLMKKQLLKKPNEYVVVKQIDTHDWVHNDAVWDGIEH